VISINIIEARMEEIFELVQHEIKRLGVREIPGGYVLTGGVVSMPGVLELAQLILNNNVRKAVPDYIGVREAQYTTGVGLIQFAYKNAKLQGRKIETTTAPSEYPEKQRSGKQTQQKVKQAKPGNEEEKVGNKVKKFFGLFFE
jgi:cell division protein FtsA